MEVSIIIFGAVPLMDMATVAVMVMADTDMADSMVVLVILLWVRRLWLRGYKSLLLWRLLWAP